MEILETLRSLSEVGIALTGFTGIVAVLGHRAGGRWGPLEWLRLRMLLETSLGVVFLSLTPVLLQQLPALDQPPWRICNGLQALVHAGGILVLYFRFRKLEPSQWPPVERQLTAALVPVSVGIVSCHVLAAVGVLAPYGSFIYLMGLIYLLGLGALHFVLLLVPESE